MGGEGGETSNIARLIYSCNNAWNHKPQVLRRESSTLINTEHKSTRLGRGGGRVRRKEGEKRRGKEEAGQRGKRVGTNGFARRYNISGCSRERKLVAVVDGRGQRKGQRVRRNTQSAGVRGWKRRKGEGEEAGGGGGEEGRAGVR